MESHYRRQNNSNLEEELEGLQATLAHAQRIGLNRNHINFYTNRIRAIQNEQKRRRNNANARRRNRAKQAWGTLRRHLLAQSIVNFWHARTHRPPNAGGAAYRRAVNSTNVGKKRTRNAATSMSPIRSPNRSPKRKSPKRNT